MNLSRAAKAHVLGTLMLLTSIAAVLPANAATLNLSYDTTYNGTTIVTTPTPGTGTTTMLAVPGSYTYANSFTSPTQLIPGTPSPGYGFFDDFIFTISGATASSITTTIDLGSTLQIQNLQERLFSAAGNPNPTLGSPVGGSIDGWTSVVGTTGLVAVLPSTLLSPGTYVLQIRGNVTGGSGGSYAGVFNVAPVPLPAALPLLLSALGGLGILSRRRA